MPFSIIASLTQMILAPFYTASIVIFWSVVYMIGCVLILIKSPKICRGIFAGSCSLGTLVGMALTAAVSAAMGFGKLGVATGAFGSGKFGQVASEVFGPSRRESSSTAADAVAPNPAATGGGGTGQNSRQTSVSMEAILATGGTPVGPQATGGVSSRLGTRKPSEFPPGTILDAHGKPMG